MNQDLKGPIIACLKTMVKKNESTLEEFLEKLDCNLVAEEARIDWDGTNVKVTAKNQAELLQTTMHAFLRWSSQSLSFGEEVIAPAIAQRILMIDIGRKFYSLEMLKALVDYMALFQFQYLQLHFSENLGFRIESEVCPEIVAADHLTKAEIGELISYCQQYQIEIIPDFDSPGHLDQLLLVYPEWRLEREEGHREKNALDITNPPAVAFVRKLYQEYAALFKQSRYFHIGADEFVDFNEIARYPALQKAAKERFGSSATAIDAYVAYVNDLAAFIQDLGFIPRVWNDGFFRPALGSECCLTEAVEISYWTRWHQGMAPVQEFLQKGYQVINHNDNYFYYVLGEAASYTYPTYQKIISEWQLDQYPQQQLLDPDFQGQQLGLALSIWSDIADAKTEWEVLADVYYLMAAMMQKIYKISLGDQEVFEAFHEKFFIK